MTPEKNGATLRTKRSLRARPDVVFRALTEAGELRRWWGPHGFTIPSVDFEPRVGTSYRIAMQPPEGELFYLAGEVREVDPPALLVYTFRWEDPTPDDRETVVTLSLREHGESTELELTQTGFATDERLALHRAGWNDSLDKLEELVASSDVG